MVQNVSREYAERPVNNDMREAAQEWQGTEEPALEKSMTETVEKEQPVARMTVPSPRELDDADLQALASALRKPNVDPMDVLRASLLVSLSNPIIANIRAEDHIRAFLLQAKCAVHTITRLASLCNITFEGAPVEESTNFVKEWPIDRLERLSCHMHSVFLGTLDKSTAGQSELEGLKQRLKGAEDKNADLQNRLQHQQSVITEQSDTQKQSLLHANTLLSNYHDQPVFIVGQLHPVDKTVQRYVTVHPETEKLSATKDFGRATWFRTFEEANDVRIRLRQTLKQNAKFGVVLSDAPVMTVMQLSARAITAQDVE